jgi:formylmethanofuran dehydrogenase subunit B
MYPHIHRFYQNAVKFQWASALLDEVRDQADMVIMWRCDPLDTHHRHLSRYSLFARGRHTERGHSDRNFVAVASKKPLMERLCQQYFEMENGKDVQFILALMTPPQAEAPEQRDFSLLVKAVTRCSYITIFIDPANMTDSGLETMFEWCAAVNNEGKKRMIIMPLWPAGADSAGFIEYCLKNSGTPLGADFTNKNIIKKSPASWDALAPQINSVLMFESGPAGGHRQHIPEALSQKLKVIITPFKQNSETAADIVIPVALPGIETSDIFFRADGLPLKVQKLPGIAVGDYPSAEAVLHKLTGEAV